MDHYDAIVIGPARRERRLPSSSASAGRRTAVVEREHVGGTCINVGCTPTKTMVASARVAYLARRAADYGVHCGPVGVDMGQVRRRKQAIVDDFRAGVRRRLESAENVELIFGEARFTGPGRRRGETHRRRHADVDRRHRFSSIPAPGRHDPASPGSSPVTALDSTSIMELQEVPEHLLVLGGGYVGLEFGQMFRRFGSAVTVVQRGKQLLAREDPDVAAEVCGCCRRTGSRSCSKPRRSACRRQPRPASAWTLRGPAGERTVAGSHLLVAAGRVPNSEQLNLAAAGVNVDARGFIPVNDRLETNVAGIYALGDVKVVRRSRTSRTTTTASIRNNLLRGGRSSTKDRLVPYTVYIDPQLGRIGLTEQEARAQGRAIRVAKIPMTRVARAVETAEPRGFIKAVVDAETRQILGAAVLAVEGGEIMSMLQIAMMGKLPYTALEDGIFAHPAFAEGLNTLFMNMER